MASRRPIAASSALKVGAVEETITVSGASPLVDIQSAAQQRTVLTRDVLDALPTARTIQAAGALSERLYLRLVLVQLELEPS